MSKQARNKNSLQDEPISLTEADDFLVSSMAKLKKFLMKWTIDNQELVELRIKNYKYTRKLNLDPKYENYDDYEEQGRYWTLFLKAFRSLLPNIFPR